MQKDYNPTLKNIQEIINTYFWVVVVNLPTTLPTREVIGKPTTTNHVMKLMSTSLQQECCNS